MKNGLLLLLLFTINICSVSAQQTELIGKWHLWKVEVDEEVHENLKAVYVFEKGGDLKAARSEQSELMDVGTWKFNEKQQVITMNSSLDDDFNGKAKLLKISEMELVYEKDKATLYFKKILMRNEVLEVEGEAVSDLIRLKFTEADFFNEDGDYKYYEDEAKLPWQDKIEMLMSLVNVTQLVYKVSTLEEETGSFESKLLKADVHSSPSEQSLSIDFIFNGYDRCNLPEDADLPPNTEYTNLLYPEEENSFRVSGAEQITTSAGTFDCTVVEVVGRFETCKKLWMINDKPGTYAKIISDKPGLFGQYSVYELQEIKTRE